MMTVYASVVLVMNVFDIKKACESSNSQAFF